MSLPPGKPSPLKKLALLLVFFIGSAGLRLGAADLVGINMTTGGVNQMSAADWAGAPGVRQSHWNNATGATTLAAGTVLNQNGSVVPGLTITIATSNSVSQRATGTANDTKMFADAIDHIPQNGPTAIKVTGIPYTNYSVYFYEFDVEVGNGSTNTRGGYFALTNRVSPVPVVRYMKNQDNSHNQIPLVDSAGSGYVLSTTASIAATDSWANVQGGNYVKFAGLTNSDFTAVIGTLGGGSAYKDILGRCITNGNSVARLKFSGFQIAQYAPPGWTTNLLVKPFAIQDQAYSGTLADSAVAPSGGTLTFSKVSGPAWLLVSADGSLSGAPTPGNVGTNSFTVRVTDSSTLTNDAVLLIPVLNGGGSGPLVNLASPNGSVVLTFAVTNFDGSVNCPVYCVSRAGRTLIANSRLALTFGSGLLRDNLTNVSQTLSSSNSTWQPVCGERSTITNCYNQLVVNLQETASPNRQVQLTFRVYDEGVAFCYTIPAQPGLANASGLTEQTEFRFPGNYPAWSVTTAQGVYASNTISGIPSGCERPLPVQVDTNLYLALGEARLVDFARMKFAPLAGETNSLVSVLDGSVSSPLPLTSPWRFVMVADSPGRLLENNYLVLNLNEPCALPDTSWIKPGKVIRSTSLTTSGGVACVDFAVKHRLAFIEFDAGWYGPENSTPTATNVASGVSLDLPYVVNYAASNGVGVILYVNWLALTNQVSVLPALYESWGIKGVKFGFVGVGPQSFTSIISEAIRRFATNHIMVDIHDEFRVTGYARTYPNLMSTEGIGGDETTPSTVQDTTLLFSRMLAGSADHTFCYMDSRVSSNWSYAYQLAKPVCFFSPWQFLYWYDRPASVPSLPELEFYDYLPTVWDETRVLQASIGQYAIIARRSGNDWFLGAINATTNRSFTVRFDFLPPGQNFIANVYSQDPSLPTQTQVRIDRFVVDASFALNMTLDASRGQAVRLTPAAPPAIQSLSKLTNGSFSLTAAGSLGLPYSLWTSPSLALPTTNWTLLNSGLVSATPFTNIDSAATNLSQRFYRFSAP